MDITAIILILAGLILFETITSIDNAIINAEVLSTMSERAKRWFLVYGLLFAVFAIRGLLPGLSFGCPHRPSGRLGILATFSSDPLVLDAIEQSAPILLIGGGTFLILLFLHWLFLEQKIPGSGESSLLRLKGSGFLQSPQLSLLELSGLHSVGTR